MHALTSAAFAAQAGLDPPSGASRETLDEVRADLETGGALARLRGRPAGCLRLREEDGALTVRRVAVAPALQRAGIGRALMAWAEHEARRRGLDELAVGVRLALPERIAWYGRLGYEVVGEHRHPGYDRPTWVSMRKRLSGRWALGAACVSARPLIHTGCGVRHRKG